MAAALVSFILGQLATITFETAWQELKLVIGVEEEVRKLQSNFEAIQEVVEDAEVKQVVDKSVKRWIDKLKDVASDMEDVLDEWNTALSKLKTDEAESASIPKKKVRLSRLPFNLGGQVIRGYDIGDKIRRVNVELDEIAKEKDGYHFARSEMTQPRRLERTTAYVDVSVIKGRNDVRDEIVSKLTSDEGSIQTVSIIGMCGIGKTALAQLVVNHVKGQNSFDDVVWVCVSDFFDLVKIAREILEGLRCGSSRDLISLQGLLDNIAEKVRDRKVFIVFDDVWTEREADWEALRAALQHCKHGIRILVTTRKESVVKVIRSSHVFRLELLSDEICWEILKSKTFFGREESERRDLEDVGMRIAKKCKGLALAAKELGSLLRQKRRRVEWERVLNSGFWELEIAEEYIFRPLLLSYYDLPSTIRRCLLYCAIFPKDYVMGKDELIVHWKMQGFLNSVDDDSEMLLKGEEYFEYLADRSLFQDLGRDHYGNIFVGKMHDLVHDCLLFMTKDEIVTKEVDSKETWNLDLVSKRARHSSIKISQPNSFPVCINGVESLRTLITIGESYDVTFEGLKKLFSEAKCLRLLDFQLPKIRKVSEQIQVPEEIGNLIHLRYLTFLSYQSLELPESVCDLRNLEYLNIANCSKLPKEMEKLINLKYLYTSDCNRLSHYPKGVGRLTSLQRLDRIIARVDCNHTTDFSVGDFENLDLLRGDLWLELEGNSINIEEVERAKLHNKIHLMELRVVFRSNNTGHEMKDNFIKALNPRPNFHIHFFGI
ncbi:hypothetical protein E1A91_A09G040300v1 [Gossypium mustelinum]|uniref:AAA+ ATPase domain-containing protein n=1 Tax=Gossypium mustelinum TaxID=34275 RepID=A0A5D2XUF3_GOSMU|nr:hypothetical protein E1A91_A09G040300v1 [Gossypium mustelinum]